MKYINLFIFILVLSGLQKSSAQYDLKNKYKELGFYKKGQKIYVQDYLEHKDLNVIDTIFLMKYKLIDTEFKGKPIGINKLSDYHCRLIGVYEENEYDCFITTSFTTEAGDGNEILMVSTYRKDGNFIDSKEFEIQNQHDYDIEPFQYFTLTQNQELIFETRLNIFELKDTISTANLRLVDKKIVIEKFKIEKVGEIIKN